MVDVSASAWIVVILGVAVVVAVVAWFVTARKFPEQADSHDTGRTPADDSGRGVQPGDVVERPAGPGAESQRPDGRGPLRPGP